MRILFTIAHSFQPIAQGHDASQRNDPQSRLQTLTTSISALHQLFGNPQQSIYMRQAPALSAKQVQAHDIDVVVCTTQSDHLLDRLPLPSQLYQHHSTQGDPSLLGVECQALLRDRLDNYDYYCFLEDNLILHDPWFFAKLNWFTQQADELSLLQPHCYAVADDSNHKIYRDQEIASHVSTSQERSQFQGKMMGIPMRFQQVLHPRSNCYFLNQTQMRHWTSQPYFLGHNSCGLAQLESPTSPSLMNAFRVYKTASEQASFFAIQQSGQSDRTLSKQPMKITMH
jgi:hypothetical protein